MARQKKTIPFSTVDREPQFSVTDEDWLALEAIVDRKLPNELRQEILKLTTTFVYFAPFENTAERLQDAVEITDSWKRTAERLQRELWKHSTSDAAVYARNLVKNHFFDQRSEGFVEALPGLLTSFAIACKKASDDMTRGSGGRQPGECWDAWVRGLTNQFQRNGLRTGVQTDGSRYSAFTLFVQHLQGLVQAEIQRHTHSELALAAAIRRAQSALNKKKKDK